METFHEQLDQIRILHDQGLSFRMIGESFDPPRTISSVNNLYRRYILPFSDGFNLIIKELKWYHLATYKEDCRDLLYLLHSHVNKQTKFRNVKLLTPMVIYLFFRLKGEEIDTEQFCQVSGISFSEFKRGLRVAYQLYLEHHVPSQDQFLLVQIKELNAELSLYPIREFYIKSLKLFNISTMDTSFDEFISFYDSIRKKISKHSKYRAFEITGSIILYMFLKTKGILVSLPKYLEMSQMGYYEFTTKLNMIIKRYYPEYIQRDKIAIVKKYIVSIFNNVYNSPGEILLSNAFLLLEFFYRNLQQSKEEVAAAVICVLTMISCDLPGITMHNICKEAGIRDSTLHRQFMEKIFPYLKIPDTLMLKKAFSHIKCKVQEKVSLANMGVIQVEENLINAYISEETN